MSERQQKLMGVIDRLLAEAQTAQAAGDSLAAIEIALLAAQYVQLAKQFERIDAALSAPGREGT